MSETLTTKALKSILISQPKPGEKSPYFTLAEKHKLNVSFRPFIEVQGLSAKEFRKCRINPLDYSAIIFTSRGSISHFFRICEELRIKMPQETKYFCVSQAISLYLQKFVQYRKRKVFYGKTATLSSLKEVLKKHRSKENFLYPCSESRKDDLPTFLEENKFKHAEAAIYRTVSSDLKDMVAEDFDMIVFFSPMGVQSLMDNFPDFVQNGTKIAAFGPSTTKKVQDIGLRLDLQAPIPGVPSMTMAIDKYIKEGK